MTVFADTFALFAWLNARDNAHAVVTEYLDGFRGQLLTEALTADHHFEQAGFRAIFSE